MSDTRNCAECGAPLPAYWPKGLCTQCAIDGALEMSDGESQVFQPERPSAPANLQSLQSGVENAPLGAFGDYDLLEEIARGGMGIVYKARQRKLDRIVAVKMILAGQLAGKEFVRRFRTEASAAAVLQHPGIVAIHDVGVHEGRNYFSMDYVDGPNLAQLVGRQPLSPPRAARCLEHIAEAIHYAHERGILHRDLKPSNVIVDTETNLPRVTDFGLAKRFKVPPSGDSAATESLTSGWDITITGQVLGSPNFMPPEQAGGKCGKVGRASDVYALGGILYYLLTARAPFEADSLEHTISQVLHDEPVAPRLLHPAIPRDLETIALKCLEKEPARRYQTAQEVASELGRYLRQEPILARPVTRPEKLWRWCRRKPVVASLSAASLILLLAIAVGSPIALYRINQERLRAEEARRNEAVLRVQAEIRENLVKAQLLCEQLRFDEAGKLMSRIPSPSLQTERKDAAIVFRALVNSFGRHGRWKEALPHAIRAVECEPTRVLNYVSLLTLLGADGDLENHRRYCREFLDRFSQPKDAGDDGEMIAKACLFIPASGADLAIVERLAEAALRAGEKDSFLSYRQFTKGLVEYRQGRFANVSDWMRKSIDDPFYGDGHMRYVHSYMVLAMAQHQLKQYHEARAAFAKGVEIEQTKLAKLESGDLGPGWYWRDWIIAHALMKEARTLIEGRSIQNPAQR